MEHAHGVVVDSCSGRALLGRSSEVLLDDDEEEMVVPTSVPLFCVNDMWGLQNFVFLFLL